MTYSYSSLHNSEKILGLTLTISCLFVNMYSCILYNRCKTSKICNLIFRSFGNSDLKVVVDLSKVYVRPIYRV